MKAIVYTIMAVALVTLPLIGGVGAGQDEAPARSYLVVASGDTLPSGLEDAIEAAGGELLHSIDEVGVAVAESTSAKFVKKAKKIQGIETVVANAWLPAVEPVETVEATSSLLGDDVDPSDDSLFFLQWNLLAIEAPEAWDEGATGDGVIVAVLDTGVSATHPDLDDNVLVSKGKSFAIGTDGEVEDWDPVDSVPAGAFNHGTHVAGIIAALDNDIGIVGVAPDAKILPVQVLSRTRGGYGTFEWVVSGIIYAADEGADVINMSLSGYMGKNGYYDEYEETQYSASEVADMLIGIKRAMQYAEKKGCTIIAALGNEAIDLDHDKSWIVSPAEQAPCIAISATGPQGLVFDEDTDLTVPSVYSNYGQSAVDLSAPGGNWIPVDEVEDYAWWFDTVMSLGVDNYYFAAGTSMAAPHAAGVAALIIGENGGDMDPKKVYAKMRKTADDLGKSGKDDHYGRGHVNAYEAVR